MSQRGKQPLVPAPKSPTPTARKPRAAPPTRAAQIGAAAGNRAVNQMVAQRTVQPQGQREAPG